MQNPASEMTAACLVLLNDSILSLLKKTYHPNMYILLLASSEGNVCIWLAYFYLDNN